MQYFKQAFNKNTKQDSMISYEVIAYQKDDDFSNKLDKIFLDMGFPTNRKDSDVTPIVNDDEIRKAVVKLSELIQDRTGMNINIISSQNGDMMTYPMVIDVGSVLFSTMLNKDNIKQLDSYYNGINEDNYDDLDIYTKAVYRFAKNLKDALKDKRLQDLVVDLNQAKIYNLPKDYVGTIFIDFKYMHSLSFTNREAAAILLHEVGHNFTSIETSYRQILNSTVIVDSLMESVKSGKSINTGLIKAYEKIYNEKVSKDMSYLDILIHMVDVEKKRLKLGAELDMNYTIDSERVADLFASRMGYGSEIVTALDVFGPFIGNNYFYFKHGIFSVLFASMITTALLVFIATLLLPPLVPMIMILVPIVMIMVWGKEYDDNVTLTYDGYYNRFLKMKLDLIRILRTDDKIDNKHKEKLLDGINTVERILNNIPKPSESVFLKIHKLFSSSKQRVFDMKRSEQLIEILQENDLWASANKIKQYS